jgi:hypothetical protein
MAHWWPAKVPTSGQEKSPPLTNHPPLVSPRPVTVAVSTHRRGGRSYKAR